MNTPRATLSTGAPVVEDGRLSGFDVDGGDIVVEGAGLNASNVDQFELITRSAQINAEIHANRLSVVAGRNAVDAETLEATAKADDGRDKPQVAIDSSALGGMYAGAIRLVGTEAGVGVKLAGDLAASAGDIQIDASGQLSMNRSAAQGDTQLVAERVELQGDTYASGNARVEAKQVDVRESLAAGGQVAVQAGHLNNAGSIEAGVHADGSTNGAGHLQLSGGSVRNAGRLASHGSLTTDLQTLDNQGGQVAAAGSATLKAGQLDNRNGQLLAQGELGITTERLDNRQGSAVAGQALALEARAVDNHSGTLAAGATIEARVAGDLNNDGGLVETGSRLDVEADSLSNAGGRLRALGSTGDSRFVIGSRLNNDDGVLEVGNASLSLDTAALSNQRGVVRHLGTGGLGIDMQLLGQAGGEFITRSAVSLSAEEWVNTSLLQAASLSLNIERLTQTVGAGLLAAGSLTGRGGDWLNAGRIESDGDLDLHLSGGYHGDGSLLTLGNLELQAGNLRLGQDAQLRSGGSSRLTVLGELVNQGRMTASSWLSLAAQTLDNRGTLGAGGDLLLQAPDVRNDAGLVFSGGDLYLLADRFVNRHAALYSLGDLSIAGDAQGSLASLIENRSGTFDSAGDMSLRAAVIANVRDELETEQGKYDAVFTELACRGPYNPAGDCDLGSNGRKVGVWQLEEFDRLVVTADSGASHITAGGALNVQGDSLTNSSSTIASAGDLQMELGSLDNIGLETGEVRTTRVLVSGRKPTYYHYRSLVENFNAKHAGSRELDSLEADLNAVIGSMEREYLPGNRVEYVDYDAQTYAAVIQSGGDVRVSTADDFDSRVIRPSYAYLGGGTRVDTSTPGSDIATAITLNPQRPADLAQQAVDPLGLPSFSLPTGDNGLFRLNVNPDHRYLIETNSALTELGNFLSSGYLLDQLGYDPDKAQKLLGDGLVEQRLVRDAVLARTGQRFIAGLDSDEAQFRYLMDNAIASQQALDLSVGVGLSAEQVAALTHDIVWMEEREVNGHKVLAPVLYLAQAQGRLAANGALVQGRDLLLVSGAELNNAGTLRATANLGIQAESIGNSGLLLASQRLQLLATDSIRNAQGGIIKGQDVSLQAGNDILNERSVATHQSGSGAAYQHQRQMADSAARIEAERDLSLVAGRDLLNVGGALSAGGDAALQTGQDLLLASQQTDNSTSRYHDARNYSNRQQIDQYGSDVQAGGDLHIQAGQDLSVVASRLNASDSLQAQAARDLRITSAANESHSFSQGKNATQSRDQVTQQSSVLQAGQDVRLAAGNDLGLIASRVQAGENVDIDAGQDMQVLSAMDENASYSFKKKKGSFGRSSSKQQESYDSTNIASVIAAGNDLTLNTSKAADGGLSLDGGRDVTVIGSQLTAGNDLLVGGTGDIAVLSGVEEHGSYSKKSKSGFLGLSKSGKSQLKTSATQVASELEAGNDVVIAAGNDIRLRASGTDAGNDVELRSGLLNETGDINLVAANDEAYSRSESYRKKFGLSASDAFGLAIGTPSWGGDIAISSAKKSGQESIRSTNVGSQVNAERDASLIAERDINVVGSGVSAGRNVLLDAGRDVNVVAGSGSEQVTSWKNTKTVGLQQSADGNGFTTFVGAESLKDKISTAEQTAAASQVEAGLDLDVRAGRDILQQGSDLQAGYDLNLQAVRDIRIDAASEQSTYAREQSQKRTGSSTTVNHNFQRTKDAVSGAGKGDNTVSQASSTLKAVDSVSQFLAGPTFDAHLGSTSQSQSVSQTVVGNRASTLQAGNEVNLQAGNDVQVQGGQFLAGRDISLSGRDIAIDVARGEHSYESQQSQGKGGFVGGTSGGFKVGIGGSKGVASEEARQGTASVAALDAGRDVKLTASNDLQLIGTQVQAGRDIGLVAGNDLSILAAQNASDSESNRRNGGGEVGLTFGSEGVGVYVSVNVGKGDLEREGQRQQEAYLYAGDRLDFSSGRDTAITGAQLEGEAITGRVGRDLTVASLTDTGEVKGREFDVSATATFGPGAGFSGSVGYGETTGSTDWVENQTRIVARDRLDIRTEEHTQIDGALLASNTGNLKLDSGTLGFSDIAGHDKERSYYLNVGGSYGKNDAKDTQQDKSQEGKGEKGKTGWSVEGYEYEKDRQQIVRATVGEGELIVRGDAQTGQDSTQGLNRDVSKAYEITRDDEERTDLYVTKSSVEAVANPRKTLEAWKQNAAAYGESSEEALNELAKLFIATSVIAQGNSLSEVEQKLVKHDVLRFLGNRNSEKRRDAARTFVDQIPGQATDAQRQAVVDYVAAMAAHDPEGAYTFIYNLNSAAQGNPLQSNFAQAAGLALAGVGAVLLVAATNPESMENMTQLGNTIMDSVGQAGVAASDQVRVSAEIWSLLIGKGTVFPIHELDPKYGTLINPAVDPATTGDASSGGYNAGGSVVTAPHTGGNQLEGQQGSGSYTTPVHQLNPGNMYSERISLIGLAQNRPLQDLTHQEILDVFNGSGFVLSNHAVGRLKDSRTKNIGFSTPNDIVKIFNDGVRFDAGNGEVGYGYKGLEAIVDPGTNRIITFRPERNRNN
ncbi:hemagglutinin repeat-containing protein [Phytopseudomonas flavescens]|uniref:hemagglutinin repeat-containing protein n=1 Tax=Phytopseudomonas flavescens TaxID=29435 RepID=UPI003133BE95